MPRPRQTSSRTGFAIIRLVTLCRSWLVVAFDLTDPDVAKPDGVTVVL